MSTSITSGSLIALPPGLDASQWASRQKRDWESSSFDGLFQRRSFAAEQAAALQTTSPTTAPLASSQIGSERSELYMPGVNAPRVVVQETVSSTDKAASADALLPNSGGKSQPFMGVAGAAQRVATPEESANSVSQQPGQATVRTRLGDGATDAARSVTVHMSDDGLVDVWIRDRGLLPPDDAGLLDRLHLELFKAGLTLGSGTINGRRSMREQSGAGASATDIAQADTPNQQPVFKTRGHHGG